MFLFPLNWANSTYVENQILLKPVLENVCSPAKYIVAYEETLQNGASHYENTPIQIYWNFYFQKTENLQIKISDIFHISAQNIDCGYSLEPPRRGGSNEYPQSMFLSRNKKNNVYLCKPQFYYIKVGFKGVKLYRHGFVMDFRSFVCCLFQKAFC